MRVSVSWLREMVDLPEEPAVVAERLTMAGLEVEAIDEAGRRLEGVVAAEVLATAAHPTRPDLLIVTVGDGVQRFDVACGAPNVPPPGGKVVLARVGARIGSVQVEERGIGGVASAGVLCSETDLDVGSDPSGLLLPPDSTPPGADAADALGLHDTVLELSVTPNRPDALGHLGVARELGAILGRPVRVPRPPCPLAIADPRPPSPDVVVVVEDPAGCPRYGAKVVRGLTVRPSPWPLRYRLHLLGVRAISNVVDVTNAVMLLFAQPQHAFDLACVRGARIVVRRARPGESMRTLDGIERALAQDDLLICDGEGPVAIAGVMGGEGSVVRPETTDVLIECAHFDPRSVRRTARRLGLSTESSYRFERGTDRTGVPGALAHAAAMMASLGGGTVAEPAIDAGGPGPDRAAVRLRPERLARIVGRSYEDDEILGTLEPLGCRVRRAGGGAFDVVAPGWRADLGREIDLVEEIARIRGFDSIPATAPALPAGPRRRGAFERHRRMREMLVARGFSEAVNHAFAGAEPLRMLGASDGEMLRLRNPIASDRARLRTTLLAGLLANVRTAFSHREPSVALFEIGRTFHHDPSRLPIEVQRLGIVMAGARPEWLAAKPAAYDIHDVAAAVAAVAEGVLRRSWALRPDAGLAAFHPRASCRVSIGGEDAGVCGEIHPAVADAFGVPRGVVVAEIGIGPERFDAEPPPGMADLPRFPGVRRDLAAIFDERVTAGEVEDAIRSLGPDWLVSVGVFDVYRGEPVPPGCKSMAFSLLYRVADRTLVDAEVDEAHAGIVNGLAARYRVTMRT